MRPAVMPNMRAVSRPLSPPPSVVATPHQLGNRFDPALDLPTRIAFGVGQGIRVRLARRFGNPFVS